MTARAKALNDFYSGPVWKAHREAANATMIDSDNVLLLCPAFPTSGFSLKDLKRAPVGADEIPTSLVVATIYYFAGPVAPDFIHSFDHTLRPLIESLGATISASFVTENSENTFPALPVRVGEMCLSGSRPFRIRRPTKTIWLLSRDRRDGVAKSRPR